MSDKKYFYLDYLRVFAAFMVILLHCICDYYIDIKNAGSTLWYIIGFTNEITRVGVPIFFMISGFLLLGKDINIKEFYKKRLIKIGIPAIIYSIFYYFYINLKNVNTISISGFLSDIANTGTTYHLWYIYSILFIYLLIPFLNMIVRNCDSKKLILLLFIVTFQTTTRPFINTLFNGRFYLYLTDDGFNGYIGYVLLGYILGNCKIPKTGKNIIYALSVLSFIIMPIISMKRVTATGEYLFMGGYSINHYIEAAGLFLWCSEHINKENRIISKLSSLSFSVYLIHVFFLEILKSFSFALPPSILMLIFFIFTSILSFAWSESIIIIKEKLKRT